MRREICLQNDIATVVMVGMHSLHTDKRKLWVDPVPVTYMRCATASVGPSATHWCSRPSHCTAWYSRGGHTRFLPRFLPAG